MVLNEVPTESLSEAQEQALSTFVTNGGKLIIHDADGTSGNTYSWLPVPANTGQSCQNCGNLDGVAEVTENNTLVSNEPSSPYYVNVNELPGSSDAVGDANVLVSNDPRWDVDILATNDNNVEDAVDAYATDGGTIIYNGFDTDAIGAEFPSGNNWLNKIWYDELRQQWDPDNLPHSTPLVGASGHCGYSAIKVGVVQVCAESISGSGAETTASGNVVLDGGIGIGNGPLNINQLTKELSVATPTPISILRGGGTVALGSANFSINATGVTDTTSGKTGFAQVSLTNANLTALAALRVGNLPFSLPLTGSLTMYLDNEMGGGLVGSATLGLPMLGKVDPSGAFEHRRLRRLSCASRGLGRRGTLRSVRPRARLEIQRPRPQLPAAHGYLDGLGRTRSAYRLSVYIRQPSRRSPRCATGDDSRTERAARRLRLLL